MTEATEQLNQARLAACARLKTPRDAPKRQFSGEESMILPKRCPARPWRLAFAELDGRIESVKKTLDGLLLKYTDQHPDVVVARNSSRRVGSPEVAKSRFGARRRCGPVRQGQRHPAGVSVQPGVPADALSGRGGGQRCILRPASAEYELQSQRRTRYATSSRNRIHPAQPGLRRQNKKTTMDWWPVGVGHHGRRDGATSALRTSASSIRRRCRQALRAQPSADDARRGFGCLLGLPQCRFLISQIRRYSRTSRCCVR